jgi:5-dehydro-2-deoxygluconokinase
MSPITSSSPFPNGLTTIIDTASHPDAGMTFSCLKLSMGSRHEFHSKYEAAYLLMLGKVIFYYDDKNQAAERTGYFEEDPIVLHCPDHFPVAIEALTDAEILIIETPNEQYFPAELFHSANMLESDHRGKDLLEDTSYRIVRTVFDKRNRPLSNLVVGEIVTLQGHWSSYPPHYHAQPEIYHYRFSEPQGFAFGENGKDVLRLKHNDTYVILDGKEHAHCTAPGYAMYTLWFIRHLPHQPYHVPTFIDEHAWTRESSANLRAWKVAK